MVAVYRACEAYVHPEHYYGFIPASDCLPVVFGTSAYNMQLHKAIEYSRRVKLDRSHTGSFTASTDPAKLADYLINHLNLITIFSDAQEMINAVKASGADRDTLQKIVDGAVKKADGYKNDLDYPVLLKTVNDNVNQQGSA
jgi:hypothetical protein